MQVDLITGDRDSAVDSRWYLIRPVDTWSNAYINPVGTTQATDPAKIVFYNPNVTDITVDIQTLGGIVSVLVNAGSSATFTMPNPVAGQVSGAYVTSQGGETFYAVMDMDADAAHTAYDWGFSLVPETGLTQMVIAGWAPGTEDLSQNGSPVWITATTATDLYIDFDGDPTTGALTDPFGNQFDSLISVDALESTRIFDNSDNDQSGLRVYTVDGTLIAAAWGLDPDVGGPGLPYLDLGTIVLPFPVPTITKQPTLTGDLNGNGLFDPGDTITWVITVQNNDTSHLTSIIAVDNVPANTTYVANSTTLDGLPVADDTVGATITPLDEGGLSIPDIAPGNVTVVTFDTTLNYPLPVYSTIPNTVILLSSHGTWGSSVAASVNLAPNLQVTKDDGGVTVNAGDVIVYTIDYANLGNAAATGVLLNEVLPANTIFHAGSSTAGWTETAPGSGIYEFNVGALAVSATGSVTFAVTVDDPLPAGVVLVNNSVSIADDGANGVDSDPSDNSDMTTRPSLRLPIFTSARTTAWQSSPPATRSRTRSTLVTTDPRVQRVL